MSEPVYHPVIHLALGAIRATGLRLDVRGAANVPAGGGAVVAINHVSYLDFVLAGVPCWTARRRLIRFMAKEAVFRHRVAGPLMRGMRHIPVDRSAGGGAYGRAVEALRAGELVGVFPEATISPSYCLEAFKTGAVRMAAEAGVPILPIVIWGSQRVLTKGRPRHLRAARGTPISISVGEPEIPAAAQPAAMATARLRARMYDLLDDAQRRYPAGPLEPSGVPAWWAPAHLGGGAPPPVTPRES
jgi:1-acyl-sn-glycerol-3-phosphate acyltransferase